MNKLLVIFFALLSFGFARAENNNIPKRDTAVYMVDDQVMFVSELNDLIGQLRKFQCLSGNSLFLRLLELDKKGQRSLPLIPYDVKAFKNYHQLISKFILFSKLKGFTQGQWGIEQKKIKSIFGNRICVGSDVEKWNTHMREFMQIELYLRDRFWAQDKKLSNDQLLVPIRSFLSSISSKTSHRLYYDL